MRITRVCTHDLEELRRKVLSLDDIDDLGVGVKTKLGAAADNEARTSGDQQRTYMASSATADQTETPKV